MAPPRLPLLAALIAALAITATPAAAHDGEFPHGDRVWNSSVGCLEYKNKGPVNSDWQIRDLITDDWAGLGVALKLDNACSGPAGDIFYRQVHDKPYCSAWDPNLDIGTADGAQEEVISLNNDCANHRQWSCAAVGNSLGVHGYDRLRDPATQNPGCLRNGPNRPNHSSAVERDVARNQLG